MVAVVVTVALYSVNIDIDRGRMNKVKECNILDIDIDSNAQNVPFIPPILCSISHIFHLIGFFFISYYLRLITKEKFISMFPPNATKPNDSQYNTLLLMSLVFQVQSYKNVHRVFVAITFNISRDTRKQFENAFRAFKQNKSGSK